VAPLDAEHAPGVRDRGLDLETVPDDAGVREQALDVLRGEGRHDLRVEFGE